MPSRLAAIAIAIAVLAAALLVGCGSSSEDGSTAGDGLETQAAPQAGAPIGAGAKSCETFAEDAAALRASGIACDRARRLMYGWQRQPSCALPASASRGGCRTGSYRCQAVRSARGIAVSCARAGQSVAFTARRG